jgi:tRNA(Ile)-lysidine synthase
MGHRSDLYARWSLEMRRQGVFPPGARIGVAVSGGPDSVLLLHFTKLLAPRAGISVAAVHFNHRLRGAESDADESFVRKLAQELGVEFVRGEADVARVARESRRNLEATARELRYRFFFSLVSQGRFDKILTAHTANDQAETVLLRLLRGTGTRGLGGIYPVLEGKVVRPFLSLTRQEVLAELDKRHLPFRLDSTNLNPRLQRNKVRMEFLPLLQKEFNPQIIPLLKQLADRARDDEAYLERQARDRALPWRAREGSEEKIPVRPLVEFPIAIARRVLRQMVQSARGSLRAITSTHIDALLRFAAEAQSGRSLTLPGGLVARREFDWLVLGPGSIPCADKEFLFPVNVPGELAVAQLGATFRFKIVNPEDLAKAYNETKVAGLDLQKLPGGLCLRSWRAGDRFRPLGSRKVRKLKELFGEHRIPEVQRKLWPVLECGNQIVWVKGFPPETSVAASEGSRQILVVEEESTPSR